MAKLVVESDDGKHRVLLFVDGEHWNATCTRHRSFTVAGHSRYGLEDVYEEAKNHVDRH